MVSLGEAMEELRPPSCPARPLSLQASKLPAQVAAGGQVSMEGERGRGRGRELKEPEDRESDIAGEREGEGGGKQAGQRQGVVRPRHPSSCENTRRPLGRSPLRAQRPLFCLFCTRGF